MSDSDNTLSGYTLPVALARKTLHTAMSLPKEVPVIVSVVFQVGLLLAGETAVMVGGAAAT